MAAAIATANRETTEAAVHNPFGIANYFTDEQFARMAELMHTRFAEAGSCLYWEGEPAGKLYYVKSGKIKLRKTTEEGKVFVLSILQAGDMLNEPAYGPDAVHGCTAEVLEDAELGVIPWADFELLLYRHGDFAVRFLGWMAHMQRVNESKFRDLLLFGKPGALASTLIRLANSYGVKCPDGILIRLKLTNNDLAEFIGTTRESINRMLAAFKAEQTVDIRKGHVVILNLDALRAVCQCPGCPGCPVEICRI